MYVRCIELLEGRQSRTTTYDSLKLIIAIQTHPLQAYTGGVIAKHPLPSPPPQSLTCWKIFFRKYTIYG